jgi:hypothetical protein
MNAMPRRTERAVIKALVNRFLMLSSEYRKASLMGNLMLPIASAPAGATVGATVLVTVSVSSEDILDP